DLDIPNISGVYAPVWGSTRCSQPASAPSFYQTSDFWIGLSANMPGGGELLHPITADDPITAKVETPAPKPDNGVSYRWMTPAFTYVRCIDDVGVDSNASGEGFEAITTDGTKYTFGWMAMYDQPDLARPRVTNSQGDIYGYAPLVRRLN